MHWKAVERVLFVLSAADSAAGRSPLSPRLYRHLQGVLVEELDEYSTQTIFQTILETHFANIVNPKPS